MRHRFFPFTAGALQGWPDRVRAPQRGLASIGPVLRRWRFGLGDMLRRFVPSRLSMLIAAFRQEPRPFFRRRPFDHQQRARRQKTYFAGVVLSKLDLLFKISLIFQLDPKAMRRSARE
jgi:hypothetical protein